MHDFKSLKRCLWVYIENQMKTKFNQDLILITAWFSTCKFTSSSSSETKNYFKYWWVIYPWFSEFEFIFDRLLSFLLFLNLKYICFCRAADVVRNWSDIPFKGFFTSGIFHRCNSKAKTQLNIRSTVFRVLARFIWIDMGLIRCWIAKSIRNPYIDIFSIFSIEFQRGQQGREGNKDNLSKVFKKSSKNWSRAK